MDIKRLDKQQSFTQMEKWKTSNGNLPVLEQTEYKIIRSDIENYVSTISFNPEKNKYDFDKELAKFIYNYFNGKKWFNERLAADDGFWRYITLMVSPNIVKYRWNYSEDYYWKTSTRIYFGRLWWYVHLSKQDNENATNAVLESNNCTEDTILNLVERTGRDGTYINVYRYIMKYYSLIPPEQLNELNKKYQSESGKNSETIFRVIMKMNTAKVMVMEPALCAGGEEGYVLSLFYELGITF